MAPKGPWEAILEAEGMPANLPPIPRGRAYGRTSRESVLADPPPPPNVRPRGRPTPMTNRSYEDRAVAFLYGANPPLSGHELFVWTSYIGRVPLRRIAEQLGIDRMRMMKLYLNPLRERAGLPTTKTRASKSPIG